MSSGTSCEFRLEESEELRLPLLPLRMPPLKCAIRKNKFWQTADPERRKNCQTGTGNSNGVATGGCPRRPLSITIPQDGEVMGLTQGSKVKSVSNHTDTTETGAFYGVTLKKGPIRRSNEDRVCLQIDLLC
jgi:hypothetical protein